MSEQPAFGYQPGLDGLRGVSILGVLLFHVCASSGLDGWFVGGNLGVSVFFTLSGFLITSLLVGEQLRTGRLDVGRFFARRVRRLAPASITVVLAVVLLARVHWFSLHVSDALAAVWSVTNWHVIIAGQGQLLRTIVGPLGPTWSLAVEEQAYAVLTVAVVLLRRRKALVVMLLVVCMGTVLGSNLLTDWSPHLEFGTEVRAGEIAVGALLALALLRWPDIAARRRTLDIASLLAACSLLACMWWVDYRPPWLLRGGFLAVALTTAVVVLGVLSHGPLHRALSLRPLVAMGRASYSLYLVHWPVFLVVNEDRTGVHGWVLVACKLVCAAVVAIALHLCVEQPIRRRAVTRQRALVGWLAGSLAVSAVALVAL